MIVTRTHKATDRDYNADPDSQELSGPKYFAKHGFADANPKKTKKDGGGKGNW
jgi:hypothetical protein